MEAHVAIAVTFTLACRREFFSSLCEHHEYPSSIWYIFLNCKISCLQICLLRPTNNKGLSVCRVCRYWLCSLGMQSFGKWMDFWSWPVRTWKDGSVCWAPGWPVSVHIASVDRREYYLSRHMNKHGNGFAGCFSWAKTQTLLSAWFH